MPRIAPDGTVLMETPPKTRDGVDEFGRKFKGPGISNSDASVQEPIDPRANLALESVQNYVGVPLIRSSGYRDATHPIESAKREKFIKAGNDPADFKPGPHVDDAAQDFYMPGLSKFEQYLAVLRQPEFREGGIGIYPNMNMTHADLGAKRQWAMVKQPDGKLKKVDFKTALEGLPGYDPNAVAAVLKGEPTPGYAPWYGPPDTLAQEEATAVSRVREEQTNAALDMFKLSPEAQGQVMEKLEHVGRLMSYVGDRSRPQIAGWLWHNRGELSSDMPETMDAVTFLNLTFDELGILGADGKPVDFGESQLKDFTWDENRNFTDQADYLMDQASREFVRLAMVTATDVATDPLFLGLGTIGAAYKTAAGMSGVMLSAMSRFLKGWGAAKQAGRITEGASTAQKVAEVREFLRDAKEAASWTPDFGIKVNELYDVTKKTYNDDLDQLMKSLPRTDEELKVAIAEANASSGGRSVESLLENFNREQVLNNVETGLVKQHLDDFLEDLGNVAGRYARNPTGPDGVKAAQEAVEILMKMSQPLAKIEVWKSNTGASLRAWDELTEALTKKKMQNISDLYTQGGLDLSNLLLGMARKCIR